VRKKIIEERSLILIGRSFLGKQALGVGGVALAFPYWVQTYLEKRLKMYYLPRMIV